MGGARLNSYMSVWVRAAVVVPLLVFLLGYSARWCMIRWHLTRVPRIDFPRRIDLGERERGEVAVAQFVIGNRGADDLIVDDIRTSCSCGGVEREVEGRLVRLESLRLHGGEQADLLMRLSVGGHLGQEFRNTVSFRTNDPEIPEGMIDAVVPNVREGLTTVPTSLDFDAILVGREVRRIINVRDSASRPARIREVVSSDPRVVKARLVEDIIPHDVNDPLPGRIIGRVEVVLQGTTPGPVSERLEIRPDNDKRPARVVFVSGRIVKTIELIPPALVLPRASGAGPIFQGECLCRTGEGQPFSLGVDRLPAGISVDIVDVDDTPGSKLVRVTWDQTKAAHEKGTRRLVRLRAQLGDKPIMVEIPVLWDKGER